MVANLFHQGKIFLHSYEKSQDEKAVCICHERADCSDIPKPIFVQKELPKTFFYSASMQALPLLSKREFSHHMGKENTCAVISQQQAYTQTELKLFPP